MNNIELFREWEGIELFFTVDEEAYTTFQKLSGDYNPLHVNKHYAVRKGFNDCVMYGNILNAFVSYGIGMALPTLNVIIQTQNIQYKKPVFLGDKVRMVMNANDIHEAVNVVIIAFTFYNQHNVIVAKGKVQIGVF